MQQLLTRLGQTTAVIGAQWGDEGKGKIVDLLGEQYDVVARACGGANAGHTIVVGGKKHIFRLIPSGCLHPRALVVLGSGMVIHLPTLLEEIGLLEEAGVDIVPRLRISSEAHILFEFHKALDGAMEDRKTTQGRGIGTTRRGIGPAYADKINRVGIRLERLGEDPTALIKQREIELQQAGIALMNPEEEITALKTAQKKIGGCVVDTVGLLHKSLSEKKRILIEGAQATLLDIDHGTYPYVTSSSTTAAGALQGLGIPPNSLSSCIGVAKAYCTRVGAGDFPTEAEETTANRLRERGGEYGSVTKRPRRCGWLSIHDLVRSARINGFIAWNITKLDVLDEEEEIPVAIGTTNGKVQWKRFPGWKKSTRGITAFDLLPSQAQEFISFIEGETHVPVTFIGTGQGREEMIIR